MGFEHVISHSRVFLTTRILNKALSIFTIHYNVDCEVQCIYFMYILTKCIYYVDCVQDYKWISNEHFLMLSLLYKCCRREYCQCRGYGKKIYTHPYTYHIKDCKYNLIIYTSNTHQINELQLERASWHNALLSVTQDRCVYSWSILENLLQKLSRSALLLGVYQQQQKQQINHANVSSGQWTKFDQ